MLTQHSLNNARDFLKRANIKATFPRLCVLKALETVTTGVTAYDIEHILIKMNQRINLATIYSILKLFQDSGLLQRHKTDSNQAVYFLNTSEATIQVRCQHCGSSQSAHDHNIQNQIAVLCDKHQLSFVDYQLIIQVAQCTHCE